MRQLPADAWVGWTPGWRIWRRLHPRGSAGIELGLERVAAISCIAGSNQRIAKPAR
jgi:hypothetical protein